MGRVAGRLFLSELFALAGAATSGAARPLGVGRGLPVTLEHDSGRFVTQGSPSRYNLRKVDVAPPSPLRRVLHAISL